MRDDPPPELLGPDDPDPVAIVNPSGASPFLLIGDHAGNAIPLALGTLGLDAHDRGRHIALDLGTQSLGRALARLLDATFIHQRFSRLVIDCNRDPARDDAMPATSDGTAIPGNAALTEAERAARVRAVHAPYHDAIAAEIEGRRTAGRPIVLVSLHSFTPRLAGGEDRPWQVGVLHDGGDDRFSQAMLVALPRHGATSVGDNEPYRMDATDYTIPRHALAALLPYAELEVRQDLLDDPAGAAEWARTLASALSEAMKASAP